MPNAPMPPLKPRVPTPEPQLDEEGNPLPEPEPDPDAPPPEKVRQSRRLLHCRLAAPPLAQREESGTESADRDGGLCVARSRRFSCGSSRRAATSRT